VSRAGWLLGLLLPACGGATFTAGLSQDDAGAGAGVDASNPEGPGTADGPSSPHEAAAVDAAEEGMWVETTGVDAGAGVRVDSGDGGLSELDAHGRPDADAGGSEACSPGFDCLSGSGALTCPPSYVPCSRPGESCGALELCCDRCP
jgi:hypothetical protein